MSFNTFPSDLPYFESLHNQELLWQQVDESLGAAAKPKPKKQPKAQSTTDDTLAFARALQKIQQLTITTNGATANSTTSNACVDLYSSLPNVVDLQKHLKKAYERHPLATLTIIFHCRSIHDGKKDKNAFYRCFFWLLKRHPRTAVKNLEFLVKGTVANRALSEQDQLVADGWDMLDEDSSWAGSDFGDTKKKKSKPLFYRSHGYWKDLLNLVSIYALGDAPNPIASIALEHPRDQRDEEVRAARRLRNQISRKQAAELKKKHIKVSANVKAKAAKEVADLARATKEKATRDRHDLRHERQQRVSHLLNTDVVYRALHFTVARLFAEKLAEDAAILKSFNEARPDSSTSADADKYALTNALSFAAKWAPSLASAHDKYSLMATSIAELLFIKDPQLAQDQRAYRLNGARELYRRQILSPLRKALDLPECRMSQNDWKAIDFSHVPSLCMQSNRRLFSKHAKDEYSQFLRDVVNGKSKVAGGVLGPQDFAMRASEIDTDSPDEERILLDGQWSSYIRALQDACGPDHSLRGSLAVCDVSGSMEWGGAMPNGATPMHAAIGLSLTLLALAAPPFTGMMITFDSNPSVVKIDPKQSIVDQVKQALKAPWGGSTNLYKVFVDLLLPMAIKFKIKQEDMVKRLFVFTDMQFDATADPSASSFDTLWETIVTKYHDAGYEPPEIVWWNLAAVAMPITAQGSHDTPGMAMVAGFSQNMLKTFMEGKDVQSPMAKAPLTPLEFMKKDLSKPSFKGLAVYD
ncbi:hypothetical protein DM01DRAFT_1407157 [Hesseltinella vesiculosa]|uniref:Uncharacterized protein n=1 Tax=Hesseltinella vesiculosa TaxID=101127 RepID=A0A1X2GJK9_9FUNG|nr:hypothetical protein DM01DRAFT_1407157 [Hesseltinella vesiculosa]